MKRLAKLGRKILFVFLSTYSSLIQENKRNHKHQGAKTWPRTWSLFISKCRKWNEARKTWNLTWCNYIIPIGCGKNWKRLHKIWNIHSLENQTISKEESWFWEEMSLVWKRSAGYFIVWRWNFFWLNIHHQMFHARIWHFFLLHLLYLIH